MRFRINWREQQAGLVGGYTVDRPTYRGGEVVDAEDYDGLEAALGEIRATLEYPGNADERNDDPRFIAWAIADAALSDPLAGKDR